MKKHAVHWFCFHDQSPNPPIVLHPLPVCTTEMRSPSTAVQLVEETADRVTEPAVLATEPVMVAPFASTVTTKPPPLVATTVNLLRRAQAT
jgi:hypothetical protein